MGCPECGSDDYMVMEELSNGEPDYDGPKQCQECGTEWQ
jgi:hypothetical protein